MKDSKINWTHHTANFWWGCVKVSDGCQNCYAEGLSRRYGKDIWGPAKTTTREPKLAVWHDILKWDREAKEAGERRRVFVSSMSDFLEDHPVANEIRPRAMEVLERLEWLDVLLLTKRPENAEKMLSRWITDYNDWPEHVWFGTTVENQEAATKRIPPMINIPSKVRFVSVEPMLEQIRLKNHLILCNLDWVICGGESGSKHRPFEWEWARDLYDQCKRTNTAFWMKQGGGNRPPHELADFPADLRVRELPR